MPNFGSGFNIRTPLDSAPISGEVISVDADAGTCIVQVQSESVDGVTWYGPDPVEGEIVYLTNAGDRLIAVSGSQPNAHDHDGDYINVTGDTMTGQLYLTNQPTDISSATRKDYVDGKVINTISGSSTTSAPSQNAVLTALNGKIPNTTQTISDWNSAITDGFYMSNNAANSPSTVKTGWWYGWVVVHNSSWLIQYAAPFAQAGIDGGVLAARTRQNGTWGTWFRIGNYQYTWESIDNFIWLKHGGNSAAQISGTNRAAMGVKTASTSPSDSDEWRVQIYDTAGNYKSSPIRVNIGSGVVTTTSAYAAAQTRNVSTETVPEDSVATVGAVVDIVLDVLDQLGIYPPATTTRSAESPEPPLRESVRTLLGVAAPEPVPAPDEEQTL